MDTINTPNLQYKTITGTVLGAVLANVAMVLRLIAKRMGRIRLRVDDYLMFVALLFHWSIVIGGIIMLYHGLGLPLSATPPDKLVVFFQTQYAGSFLYTLTVAFTKSSILYMYWRVFDCRTVRFLVYLGFILVTLWTTAVCLTAAFTCIPVRKMWNPQVPGKCISIAAFYYGVQIPNILTDIYIILLPVHEILQLSLERYQKVTLIGIFGIATATAIFDVIRLVALIKFSKSTEDVTIAIAETTIWTCVEPAVGILAACASNLRPLYRRVVGRAEKQQERSPSPDVSGTEHCVPHESSDNALPPSSRVESTDTRLYATSEVERNVLLNGPFSSTYATCNMTDCSSCYGSISSEDQTVIEDWRIYQHYGVDN